MNKGYADRFIDEYELLKIIDDDTIVRNDQDIDMNGNNIINANKIKILDNNPFEEDDVIKKNILIV